MTPFAGLSADAPADAPADALTDISTVPSSDPEATMTATDQDTADQDTADQDTAAATWTAVCRLDELVPERGAAALLARGDGAPVQVAVYRLLDDSVHAVQQLDPYSGAYVMSRGIVGTRGEEPTVASPIYKQVFALRTGECLESGGKTPKEDLGSHLEPFPAEVRNGVVHVRAR